jgi:hypothetical protein
VLQGDAPDEALQPDRVVAGEHGVVHVVKVDLELARAVLGEHGAGGQLLQPRGLVEGPQHHRVLVQVGHRIDLRLLFPAAGQRLARRLRAPVGRTLAIDQVELELDRHHGGDAEVVESPQHRLEHVPRVAVERRAVVLVHRHLHLCDLLAEPRDG